MIENYRSIYGAAVIRKYDPIRRANQKKSTISVRRANVRLALAQLTYIRFLRVITTDRGDEGFLQKLFRDILKVDTHPSGQPLGHLFDHVVKFTLVSKSQIEQTRYFEGFP